MTLNISRFQHSRDPQNPPTVREVQRHLVRRGFHVGPTGADGRFGSETEKAVVRFQAHRGLVADGIVGPKTWRALSAAFPHPDPDPVGGRSQAVRFADVVAARATGTDGAPRPHYVFGYEVADLSSRHPSAFDCSELVQWGVYQVTGDDWVDGSRGQYEAAEHCSLHYASEHEGVLVFLTSNGSPSGIHHVGVTQRSDKGVMGVGQARSAYLTPQCGWWPFDEQPWNFAARVPILHY